MLEVRALEAAYGASQVLFGVDLDVGAGEVVTLLGRNGRGKTTTVRAIMGLLPPRAGTIDFAGAPIAGAPAHRVAQAGLGLVPEGRQVFANLTVRENLVATARAAPPAAGPSSASSACSRSSPSAPTGWARSSPAASSRCSRSAAR